MLSKRLPLKAIAQYLIITIISSLLTRQGAAATKGTALTTSPRQTAAFLPFLRNRRKSSGENNNIIMDPQQKRQQQRLVLVGGGHAHVQVIRALNKVSRPENLHVTLIDTLKSASYSGMVPGCISGRYQPEETLLHLQPLAKWAGIDFIQDRVVDIDVDQNRIFLANSDEPIAFDAISLDIGSASRGLQETKGARKYTIPTRPIADLVTRMEHESEALSKQKKGSTKAPQEAHLIDVVVIGGGAAGIELSMSVMGRWESIMGKDNVRVTLLDAGQSLLPNESPINRQTLLRIMEERGIEVRHGCVVQEVKEDCVILENGQVVPFSHCLWAAGAGAHDLALRLQRRGLAVSDHGWIQVNPYLQSLSHPQVFAAGDCATIEGLASGNSPPKAGVYAVRSGPILIDNLTRFLENSKKTAEDANDKDNDDENTTEPLTGYKPQDDFLKLLVCGDGTALGFRFGIPIHGKWVFELKDAIDNNFMNLFRAERLPNLVKGQNKYDTSQYDATPERPPPMDPSEAAALLQRTDDDVDYQKAWNVLRDMTDDGTYRKQVLEHVPIPEEMLVPN